MSPTSSRSTSASRRTAGRIALGAVAVGVVTGLVAVSTGGAAQAASKQLSHSSGRFLSGSAGGQSFDTVAGIEGEKASYPSTPGPNKNSLNAELLNGAITLPFGSSGLQLPDPTGGAIQLGAVAQYAAANKDGSSVGASGAVDSNGGIGVAGSNGVPTGGATLDLSGSKALSAITTNVADLKLTIGALSARANQVAVGDKTSDPSASCTSGGYRRVSDADQAGRYNIAGLSVDLTSPLIARLGSTLDSALNTVLTQANIASVVNQIVSAIPASAVTVTGLPSNPSTLLNSLLKLSLANGAITIDLVTGALHVDLAALLKFLGLDINKLCPNTSLLPYVAKALTSELPSAIQALLTSIDQKISDTVGGISLTLGGALTLSLNQLTSIISSVTSTLTGAAKTLLGTLDTSALNPLLTILSNNLLNLVGNGQDESSAVLTQTSLQLNLLPGGGSAGLPTIPGLPSLPGVPTVPTSRTASAQQSAAHASYERSHPNSKHTDYAFTTPRVAAARAPKVSALALSPAAAAQATVVVNLAQATVGPNDRVVAPTPTPTTSTPTTQVPTTSVPTGVPAGQGAGGGSGPDTPLVLVLVALGLAAGGVTFYRFRGARASH